jgi:hypothetical protein
MYTYPWGSRKLNDVCHYQTSQASINGPRGIDHAHRTTVNSITHSTVDNRLAARIHPVLFCHDQEPLAFDLYNQNSQLMQEYAQEYKKQFGISLSPTQLASNLRAAFPEGIQQQWILLHSELNSLELTRYESTNQFVGAYWWSHAVIARDWYRFAEYDQALQPSSVSKVFLVYSRESTGWREYRKQFNELLLSSGVLNACQTHSFHQNPVGPEASAIYEVEDFNRTSFSVVLETVFDQRIHLTEKTLRPIACGHPFLLVAGPGALKLLRSYGFKTFQGYINESYDDIHDNQERLLEIINEMDRITKLPIHQLINLIESCRAIAEYNKSVFFSDKFLNQVKNELYQNVHSANSRLTGLDFEAWWNQRKWHHSTQHQAYKQFESTHNPGHSLVTAYRQIRLDQSQATSRRED